MLRRLFMVILFTVSSTLVFADTPISDLAKALNGTPAADTAAAASTGSTNAQSSIAPDSERITMWYNILPYLCLGLALFSLMYFTIVTIVVLHTKSRIDILKIYVTPLVIIVAIFVVLIGFSETQISPIIGLLGTIVGFLLGKRNKSEPPTPAPEQEKKDQEKK